MPTPKRAPLTRAEAAALNARIEADGEVTVARAANVHRQTVVRAVHRLRLYTRQRESLRDYLRSVA